MDDVPRECKRFGGPVRGWVYKQRFDTRRAAIAFNKDSSQVAYCCWHCGFWHLGHQRVQADSRELHLQPG